MSMASAPSVFRLADSDEADWDAFVTAAPGAQFFHRAGWRRVIEDAFGRECPFLLARRGAEICGILPLVHVHSRLFGKALISTGFTVGGGPLTTDSAAEAALLTAAGDLASDLGADYLELRGDALVGRDISDVEPSWIDKAALYAGFTKPISPDHDANMLAIPRKQRAMVRKGIKAGLESTLDTNAHNLYAIYSESLRNLGTPVFSPRYFQALMTHFAGDIDIVTIRHEGQSVASVMNFYFRDQVLPYYGGGVAAARPVAGNDFMYWEVMRRAADRGCTKFDFGRSKVDTGAYFFKKNWGFEPMPLTYRYLMLKGDTPPDINPLNPKYRLFIRAWKSLPLWVANRVGPLIARNLG